MVYSHLTVEKTTIKINLLDMIDVKHPYLSCLLIFTITAQIVNPPVNHNQ